MSPEQIVRVTAAISMALAFLEPADPDIVAAQNVQERRICDFDRMIVACRFILEVCGQTKYLCSIYELWHHASQSLYLLERMLWPGQTAETSLHLVLPPQGRPLTEILLEAHTPSHDAIFQAVPALETFTEWFVRQYDTGLHSDFYATLIDAMLVLRTAEMMIRMKRRCDTLALTNPAAAAHMPAASSQPTAASSSQPPAASEDHTNASPETSSATGTPLEFY